MPSHLRFEIVAGSQNDVLYKVFKFDKLIGEIVRKSIKGDNPRNYMFIPVSTAGEHVSFYSEELADIAGRMQALGGSGYDSITNEE